VRGVGVHRQSVGVIHAHSRVKSRYKAYPVRHAVCENRGGHEKDEVLTVYHQCLILQTVV
jgi:hypothetical protein